MKMSAEDLANKGGFDALMTGDMEKMFGGATDMLGNTSAGKWSTVMGKTKSMMSNMGKSILDRLNNNTATDGTDNSIFGRVISAIDGLTTNKNKDNGGPDTSIFGTFNRFLDKFTSGIKYAMDLFNTAKESFSTGLFSNLNLGDLKEKLAPTVEIFKQNFGDIKKNVSDAFNFIGQVVAKVMPIVADIIATVMPIIKKMMDGIKPILKQVGDAFLAILDAVADVWPTVSAIISKASEIITPVMGLIAKLAELVVKIFQEAWPMISGIVEGVWAVVEPIFSALASIIGSVADALSRVCDWFITFEDRWNASKDKLGKVGETTPEQYEKDMNDRYSSDRGMSNNTHASGLSFVPYDGYQATLHQGERVITANENRNYNSSKSKSVVVNNTFNLPQSTTQDQVREIERLFTMSLNNM